jgi:tRNA threonylcarbamoyl adenosine modification protein YeaZ
MKILAIETTTSLCSVAITENEELLAEINFTSIMQHSQFLLPSIDILLNKVNISINEIDAFSVSIGPGSFTGIRVGISLVKGFSFSTNKPVVGVPTLDAIAYQSLQYFPLDKHICVIVKARKDEMYCAIYKYNGSLKKIMNEKVMKINELKSEIIPEKTIITGNAISLYSNELTSFTLSPSITWVPYARTIAKLAFEKIKVNEYSFATTLSPLYVQKPQLTSTGLK